MVETPAVEVGAAVTRMLPGAPGAIVTASCRPLGSLVETIRSIPSPWAVALTTSRAEYWTPPEMPANWFPFHSPAGCWALT